MALGVEFIAVISGYYGGALFTSPTQAADYVAGYGLDIPATYDPEGFWGAFSEYIPSNVIINLQTMRIEYLSNTMDDNDLRSTLDSLLGL